MFLVSQGHMVSVQIAKYWKFGEYTSQFRFCRIEMYFYDFHGKSLLTPNRNRTYNMHYFVDIPVWTIG